MKSGSASIDRHEETQAPHWMQAIDWVTSIIDSRLDDVLALRRLAVRAAATA